MLSLSSEFIDMLNEMRFGRLSQESITRFKYLSRPIIYEDGLGATELSVLYAILLDAFINSLQLPSSRGCREG